MRILVTTTSFLDTPGLHLDKLRATGFEIVPARGPLQEASLIKVLTNGSGYDGVISGEDEFTRAALVAASPRLKVISRYGVGVDKVDLEAAKELGVSVSSTPGSNHTTVAEHTFGLLLSVIRRIPEENNLVHGGEWKRFTGIELAGKTIGVLGFGRVGKEVAKRAMAFGMKVVVFNTSWSSHHTHSVNELTEAFSRPVFSEFPPSIERVVDEDAFFSRCEVLSIHINLTQSNRGFINRRRLGLLKKGSILINVSRGGLVDQQSIAALLRSGQLAGYGADVLDPQPVTLDNPLRNVPNVVLTPHIGSRTRESVERQGVAAVMNLLAGLQGAPGASASS